MNNKQLKMFAELIKSLESQELTKEEIDLALAKELRKINKSNERKQKRLDEIEHRKKVDKYKELQKIHYERKNNER